ncbi:unnamed protein product [Clonostachys rhizophaga]|uniref:Major facilitator superfamily (MFS) profile domain-containing protein n=1 Tax=Clonostachys rhizophaga TaxID=160324 RepID=A0A9N9YI14_9HYPO|nr:unnamed protein product [Clonostachys rhizophaga]
MSDHRVVPGTVYLVDVQHISHSKHTDDGDIVLVPMPTDDPEDPLNWSRRRKLLSVTCMAVYMVMVGLSCSLVYSIIVPVAEDTGLSVADLNAGTGYSYLAFGWSCLIWQPAAKQFGKRPIYLISLLLTIAVTISVPYALSPGAWMAMKILGGLAGGPLECLGEISIADVFCAHERGKFLAIYAFVLFAAGFLAPILAGFINDGMGWRWTQYWATIWLAIGFIFCFFFMEETNFTRTSVLVSEETQNEIKSKTIASDEANRMDDTGKNCMDDTKGESVLPTTQNDFSNGIVTWRRKTYLQKLKMFDNVQPIHHFWSMVLRPLRLLSYPVIVYCGFSYGCSLIWYSVLNGTASVVLSSPPYNFSASYVGLTYISPMIGVGVGSLIAGNLGDVVVIWLARRNKGIWHSEYRQWMNAIMVVLLPGSLLLWGLGAEHGIHWFGLVLAMGLIGCCIAMGAHLSLSYCIDTYTDFGADAVVATMCIRNTMGFAIGYGITPWTENLGYQNAFLVAAAAGLLQVLTFLIMVKWGPQIRERSTDRYRRDVDRAIELGITH